ncbi:hypothetical protein [Emticicia sp.]|uniref:hypothetical protein n=1 Tax=Emticicia sp. TaxID=1930953 RepID=UPI00375246C0
MSSQDLINYLELLATQSKQIRHNINEKKKFGYYENLSVTGQKQMAIRDFCLWIYKSVLVEKILDNGSEQYFARLTVQFEISKSISSQESILEITQAQIDGKEICRQFWRRILNDERMRKHIFSQGIVRLESNFDFEDIEGDYENLCGCAMKFTLKWQVPGIDDDYDETDDFITT